MAKILIVDDSSMQLKMMKKMLQKHGHTTIESTDGAKGISLAQTESPDLILLDVVMPDINGFDATRQLRNHPDTQHIPIILVSGKSQETDKQWGLRQGAKGYLVKPFKEAELIDTISPILAS